MYERYNKIVQNIVSMHILKGIVKWFFAINIIMDKIKSKFRLALICLMTFTNVQEIHAKWNFSLSSGYGVGQYEKTIVSPFGSYLYKDKDDYILSTFGKEKFKINWFYDLDIKIADNQVKGLKDINDADKIVFFNIMNKATLKSVVHTIPITASIYYEFWKKFRVGFGANISCNIFQTFLIDNPTVDDSFLNKYRTLVRKIMKKQLNSENIVTFRSTVKYMPKSYLKQLETAYALLDPVEDINDRAILRDTINGYSETELNKEDVNTMREYRPRFSTNFMVDPFILFGFKFIENVNYSGIIDVQVSPIIIVFNSLDNFYALKTYTLPLTLGAYSLGLTIEKHISEYYRFFGRLAYKTFNVQEVTKDIVSTYNEKNWNISLQFGVCFDSPEIERCPVDKCRIQAKHRHNSERFRGSNMFVGENARGEKLFTK